MSFEEKSAWIMGVLAGGMYAAYLTIILGRAADTPLVEVPYASTLLWTIGISIVAAIVLHLLVAMAAPRDANKKDRRDREIYRFGEYAGQSFVVGGGLVALGLSMAEWDYFWIANVIYLGFVLSGVVGSAAKIVAYRRGLPQW